MSDSDESTGPSIKKPRLDLTTFPPKSILDKLLADFEKKRKVEELSPYTELKRLVLDDDVLCVVDNLKEWLNTRLLIFILRMCPALEVLHLFSRNAYVYKLNGKQLGKIFDVMPPLKELRVECLEFKDDLFDSIRKIKSLEILSLYVPMNVHVMHWDCFDFIDNLPSLRLMTIGSTKGRWVMNPSHIRTRREEGVSSADFI